MAKRKGAAPAKKTKKAVKKAAKAKKKTAKARKSTQKQATRAKTPVRSPKLSRKRRTLEDVIPTPPSSLDMKRRGTAARTGRAGLAERLEEQRGMEPAITGGDVDVDLENAYFTGDEVPGGDNPTPDQEVVDDIGRALGVQYEDNEELKSADKVTQRDKHRWELDPASAEDYKDRK
jgi:hypothetical protein